MKILIALLMLSAGLPATMNTITAILLVGLIIILMLAGFGVLIMLGTFADWISEEKKQ